MIVYLRITEDIKECYGPNDVIADCHEYHESIQGSCLAYTNKALHWTDGELYQPSPEGITD